MKKLFVIIAVLSLLFAGNAMAQTATAGATAGATAEGGSANASNDGVTINIGDPEQPFIQDVEGDVTSINRNFVNPGVTPLPQTNGFFTAPTPDSSFKSINEILRQLRLTPNGRIRFSEATLKNMAKGGKSRVNFQVINSDLIVPRDYTKGEGKNAVTGKDLQLEKYLIITTEKPIFNEAGKIVGLKKPEGLITTAFVDGEAVDAGTNSLQVLGKAGLKAIQNGNNCMVITAEGAHRMVVASGWGIGFYSVTGGISDSGKTSLGGGGGTGFAKNHTAPEDRPWIQGYAGVIADGNVAR
jgi:hypothetical protein